MGIDRRVRARPSTRRGRCDHHEHSGTSHHHHIDRKGKLREDIGKVRYLADRLLGRLRALVFRGEQFDGIADHMMSSYVAALEAL